MVIKILGFLRWVIYEYEFIVISMDLKSIFELVIVLSIEYILLVERINMYKNFIGLIICFFIIFYKRF